MFQYIFNPEKNEERIGYNCDAYFSFLLIFIKITNFHMNKL